jgi:hypothetical protein
MGKRGGIMTKLVSVACIVACLFILSACQTSITPALDIPLQSVEEGGKVSINASIDAIGWLVLHPATKDGSPDTSVVLKKTYLTGAGEWTDIQITVPMTVGEERTIFARLYYDNPVDRIFDPSSDNTTDPVVTTESGIVQDSFTVAGIPPYIEIEQSATTGKVTFTIGLDAAGWLIIRPETTGGEMDTSVILAKALFTGAGEYDLTITLPGTVEAGETIYAALHYDDPADEAFTYTPSGDDDPPVQAEGSDVIESFEVSD